MTSKDGQNIQSVSSISSRDQSLATCLPTVHFLANPSFGPRSPNIMIRFSYCSVTRRVNSHVASNTTSTTHINPLNAELNPIRHLLALVGARHIVHVGRIRVKQTKQANACFQALSAVSGQLISLIFKGQGFFLNCPRKTGSIGCPETSVITQQHLVTSQKSEDPKEYWKQFRHLAPGDTLIFLNDVSADTRLSVNRKDSVLAVTIRRN